jgi:beta-phosphoglucomutase-like phosphatase (HAD superfamily)
VVVGSEDVARTKPSPEPYLRAAELLGVRAEDCVAVEDSPNGLAAAIASGATTIAVPNDAVLPESGDFLLWPTLAGRTVEDLRDSLSG